MAEYPEHPQTERCGSNCQATASMETLNQTCYCLSLDEEALQCALAADLGTRGMSRALIETHPHLFASVPLFVSRQHIDQMACVIRAVEAVVATPYFQRAALAWAPEIASFNPGSLGGLLGYDFHLAANGPQLIEINTNPGGALLNAVLARAHRSCCAGATILALAPMEADAVEESLFEVFITEWHLQRRDTSLLSVAIVDEAPEQQYLHPEFLLYRQLLERRGIQVIICDPRTLRRERGQMWHDGLPIDFIYNRLTDFALEQPAQAELKLAYLADEVVFSPHPRGHALYADKRNLTLLCDGAFLREAGVADDEIATLLAAIPRTESMTTANRDALWAWRRKLFFKPAAGYGGKAAYRGDKLTKRVWEEIATSTYVAQALVAPSERYIAEAATTTILKADVRNYAYDGVVKLVAARLYQGQTTNFRTPGGGFAPVFTETSVGSGAI